MSSFEPKPFGKYFLIDRLAMGGMAEIYKAKTFGVDGFEKTLAIKKILPHYSADKEFISMLTDEAKLVVRLSHTNIVQVYDLGKINDDYYISMEFIDGVNLREVLTRSKELQEKIPLPICLYIISETCKGLDYAHSKMDEQGTPLEIVHRDISPQNILISFEGETKIVDFGIAKAALNVSQTTLGTLKGKVTYMSPEHALGKPVDGRTDIFSTGLLLYELITGERFFKGETQMEVLRKIRSHAITEKDLEDIPKNIRSVLAKALAYNTKDRYETAGDFQVALTRILYSQYNDFSPKKISNLVRKWFKETIDKKSKEVPKSQLDKHTKSLLLEADGQESLVQDSSNSLDPLLFQETTKPDDGVSYQDLHHGESFSKKVDSLKKGFFEEISAVHKLMTKKSRRKISYGFMGIFVLAFMFLIGSFLFDTPEKETEYGTLKIQSDPSDAFIYLNNKKTEFKTPAQLKNLNIAKSHDIGIEKDTYRRWNQRINFKDEKDISLKINLDKLIETATLKISSTPNGAEVYLNSRKKGKTPLTLSNLEMEVPIEIGLKKEDYEYYESRIVLNKTDNEIQLDLEPLDILASLNIKSEPSDAKIFIDSKETNQKTPSLIKDLQINKKITISLKKEGYLEHKEEILFEEAKLETKLIKLQKKTESIDKTKLDSANSNKNEKPKEELLASLFINSNPTAALLFINNKKVGLTPIQEKLKPGTYQIKLEKRGFEVYEQSLKLVKKQQKSLRIRLNAINQDVKNNDSQKLIVAKVRLDSKPRGASVIFNGSKAGITPLLLPEVSSGQIHQIQLSLPGYKNWTRKFKVQKENIEFMAILEKDEP